ncbi:hypothetical protein [Desulfosporosinus sp. FKB]|uniref:hypothetical protein n=1 Tax=Desulfosporosinus sp. FKB TaxID=1969835 RepID=UPI000B4A2BD3|nr:hypothetical protein [Desulfosporosinus sp. FKB]
MGRVPGLCVILDARPAGNVLFPALLDERGVKAKFGSGSRKGFSPVIAPLALKLGWRLGIPARIPNRNAWGRISLELALTKGNLFDRVARQTW